MATVVSLDVQRRKQPKALDALVALVENDLKAVNQTIVARMHSPVALIPQLADPKNLFGTLLAADDAAVPQRSTAHAPALA